MVSAARDVSGCEEVVERMSEFLDGELDENAAARVAFHLAACARCVRFAAELVVAIEALHGLPKARSGSARPAG